MLINVLLPIKTVSLLNKREHFMARAARAKIHRSTAYIMLKAWGKPPELPVTVTMTRLGVKLIDTDNCSSCFKNVRDGIADWLGVDDGDSRVTWVPAQRLAKNCEYGVVVEIKKC
jgi:hypothetical protein